MLGVSEYSACSCIGVSVGFLVPYTACGMDRGGLKRGCSGLFSYVVLLAAERSYGLDHRSTRKGSTRCPAHHAWIKGRSKPGWILLLSWGCI